jgi:uncharacterized protein (DUF1330 family)
LDRACRCERSRRLQSLYRRQREVFRKYGAHFVVRGGKYEAVEGRSRERNVVIEFKDYATALACYRSPEYAKAAKLREGKATADIIVIEGYDGPQPA